MTTKIKTIGITTLLLIVVQLTYGQTNTDKALSKGKEAIQLMDNGKVDESIKLLKEAQKLDPEKIDYPYELAYAYYLKEDYKESIKILEKITNHKDVTEIIFQLLGNSYDMIGKSDKALDTYDTGLKKFPTSGKMYLEKGNVYWTKKEFEKALSFYEKGIEINPQLSSNYYRATKIYCSSTEEVWGMIYGEIFMNLERNSERTAEISKLLFDTYKSEIKFTSDSSYSVSFSQNSTISINDLSDSKNFKLPFGTGCYEMALMLAVVGDKQIDINSLDRIRSRFVDNYFKGDNAVKYPNVLFDYQQKIKSAGHFEAYNHWILMKGDETGFELWVNENKDKWDSFVKWFTANPLRLDNKNKFYRGQY